jgi:hypothetical protein
MHNESKTTPLKSIRSVPRDIQALFGDPPLLSTEDPNLYRDMLHRFAEFVDPKNIIEWLWVKDIVDLSWEIARLRRYRALLIERERESKNAEIDYAREHAGDRNPSWLARLKLPQIEELRNAPRLDTEADSASLLILQYLGTYETVDKLLMSAELRRDRILRELDFRRERIAPLLRKTSDELIDARADAVPVATE